MACITPEFKSVCCPVVLTSFEECYAKYQSMSGALSAVFTRKYHEKVIYVLQIFLSSIKSNHFLMSLRVFYIKKCILAYRQNSDTSNFFSGPDELLITGFQCRSCIRYILP